MANAGDGQSVSSTSSLEACDTGNICTGSDTSGTSHLVGRDRRQEVHGSSHTHREFTYVKGFRDFITRGNLIELAVAVVIGTAFTAVVTAVVADLITPLIAAIGGKPNFAGLTFTVNHSKFLYGAFINAAVTFLIVAAVIYFLIVSPMAKIMLRMAKAVEVTTRDCPECLSSIPIAATRCMYCTVTVPPVTRATR
jgi:large conductance mechanosensitive channel